MYKNAMISLLIVFNINDIIKIIRIIFLSVFIIKLN